jgi:hypothetical protein
MHGFDKHPKWHFKCLIPVTLIVIIKFIQTIVYGQEEIFDCDTIHPAHMNSLNQRYREGNVL